MTKQLKRKKGKEAPTFKAIEVPFNLQPTQLNPCFCGHSVEEHGDDPKYPGSTACNECEDCIAYDPDDSMTD